MCYFGFPVAREDAASQALRAGLELIDAVQTLGLSVRIGVCTGEVVVRDGQPVGPAIHFAARLQKSPLPEPSLLVNPRDGSSGSVSVFSHSNTCRPERL